MAIATIMNVMVPGPFLSKFSGVVLHLKVSSQPTNIDTHWSPADMAGTKHTGGFTLMELLIAMFLSAVLVTAIIQLVTTNVSSYRLQLAQSHLQASSQYAREVLVAHISQAGYQPDPWNTSAYLAAVTSDAVDNFSTAGDQLGLQRWSRQNCYGSENSSLDSDNLPAAWLLQAQFKVTDAKNLAMTCRYGAASGQLVTQMNNFGLIEGVEFMQVLYAEDTDNSGVIDSWVRASQWQQEAGIRAIKVALLLASQEPFNQKTTQQVTLLDETLITPADGRLRRTSVITTAINGRLP